MIERDNNIFASAASSDRSNLVTPLRMDVYIAGMVMQAQCALGKWHDAITTHDKLREHWLTENVDAQTLEKLRNSQKQWRSIETDHLERTVAQKADRFRPNHVTYTLAIDACAKIGDDACLRALREMSRGGIMEILIGRVQGHIQRQFQAVRQRRMAPRKISWRNVVLYHPYQTIRYHAPMCVLMLCLERVRIAGKTEKRISPYHGDDNVRSVSSSDESTIATQ